MSRGNSYANGPTIYPPDLPRPVTHWDFTEGRPAE